MCCILLLKVLLVWTCFQEVIVIITASTNMSDSGNTSSSKKTKDRIQQLSELRRGLVHHTDAQYGTANDPMFVMHISVDGMVNITLIFAVLKSFFCCSHSVECCLSCLQNGQSYLHPCCNEKLWNILHVVANHKSVAGLMFELNEVCAPNKEYLANIFLREIWCTSCLQDLENGSISK